MSNEILKEKIMIELQNVKDPEIDSISIIELGMLEKLVITNDRVDIHLLPTFLGCPALDIIKKNILKSIDHLDRTKQFNVQFDFSPPWTSERVTEEGRERLKEFGIAPPPKLVNESGRWQVDCPYCNSSYTTMENIFGPTACRSILYCKTCKNPFEAMKPVSTMM
ncbi:1,2-phenylacetyl-CoA epoxidase subunit PaaD [Fredinandcohnia quinoae]|uniref:Phenylacetate-CoA oxygenase subunit PaaJ n=1 Tax=Fredinandcohnia quinoae TaxID=2918902 RepID=A0AAW5E4Y4_9BACI|nr:1,2-phenylacetyl-CoA epoxidase subunit PaaD [Fredinandcohnia sp. SECRCQ15]MCH1626300.1 phenylacetate-CoA oxygenase subunit PaaJ [Fredinandcohnia sp. SECRCQ15]